VDLFPPEWIAEFEKLQDEVPPLDFSELYQQLCEDLGDDPQQVFVSLDSQALAAGSIGQVHRAVLPDGAKVILKIRRPGIRPIIEADLRLLLRMSEIIEREIPELRQFHPTAIVKQVMASLRRELDFAAEGRNAERIATAFAEDPDINVPKIYWQWTSERLNVQSLIDGVPGRDLQGVREAGLDLKVLARRGADAVLKMVVDDGFFHADPHPGNIFFLPQNRIVFIDTGMVGRLSETRRVQVIDLIRALVSRDTAGVIDVLIEWSYDTIVSEDSLTNDIDTFLDNYHGVPLKNINFATMLRDLTTTIREHSLVMPPDLALLVKVFITLEGFGRQLNPDFDMIGAAEPFIRRSIHARYQPQALARRGIRNLAELSAVVSGLPRDLRRMVKTLRRGSLQFNVELNRLGHFGKELNRAANRLTVGLVTSALIIGTSIVMTVQGGPKVFGLPFLGFIGFLGAGISGVWLLISIWRSGKD